MLGGSWTWPQVTRDFDITLTVETHNFPCGIAPFPGNGKKPGLGQKNGYRNSWLFGNSNICLFGKTAILFTGWENRGV
jgi:hypothetical protein